MRQTVKFAMTAMMAMVGMCAAAPVFAQGFDQTAPVAQGGRAATSAPPAMALPAMAPPSGQQAGIGQRPATPQAAAPAPPAATASHRPDAGVDMTDANIKLTLTINDKGGAGNTTKAVTLLVANMGSSQVRSSGNAGSRSMRLDVDANGELRKSGLIRLNLTVHYQPEQTEETGSRLSNVDESVSLFLKDGVATVITQAADPTKGARSVEISVTATVVK